jgi:nitrite reductase (NO-forming)
VAAAHRGGSQVKSHRIAAAAFRLGGVFGLIALRWSVWVMAKGGSWWGAMHAFLAGTVLLAISGATQLFTITRAAAPPPRASIATSQRWAVAIGVGLALIGMTAASPWAIAAGAGLVVVGLISLAVSVVGAVRRSLLKRFDLSSRFYLLALAAGTVGVSLGGLMGLGVAASWYPRIRLVHSHLNLVGLVGFTIVGTLPTILSTSAHHRSVSGREVVVAWWIALVSAATITMGLAQVEAAVGLGTVLAAAALLNVLAGVLGRLGRRSREGGLPFLQVTVGCGWLVALALVDGGRLLVGSVAEPFGAWTGAVVIAGLGQILLGSLAYLLPVLAGPGPRLGRNLERANGNPWLPFILANVAGLGFVAGFARLASVVTGLWVLDFGSRLARIEWRDSEAPAVDGG